MSYNMTCFTDLAEAETDWFTHVPDNGPFVTLGVPDDVLMLSEASDDCCSAFRRLKRGG